MRGPSREGRCVGGLLDVLIGVPDLVTAIAYWELFGFRVGQVARFEATLAHPLYGVGCGGRAARLFHQRADHGLVRLVQWDEATGPGLGMAPFKVIGSRWSAAEVGQLARIAAHAKYARLAGQPIEIFQPDVVPAPDSPRDPFRQVLGCAFEMAMLQPLWRQVLFERADFPSPLYGTVAPGSLLQGSQLTHCCVVTQSVPDEAWSFYDRCLGLRRSGDFPLAWQDIGSSGRDILGLAPGEGFRMVRFDDPRSGDGPAKRSGRLIFFDFARRADTPDCREATLPGALGHTLYSWRVADAQAARTRVVAAGATAVSDLLPNEFGESGFTCRAPDGTPWAFMDAAHTLPLREQGP